MGKSGAPDREEAGMSLLRRVIGGVLRRIRLRQGRTLREVAQAAGVSLPYLSEVERGRKEASSEVLAAICRALGIHLADLLEEARDELRRERPTPVVPGVSAARFDRVPVARTASTAMSSWSPCASQSHVTCSTRSASAGAGIRLQPATALSSRSAPNCSSPRRPPRASVTPSL
ncbi:transcriptional regulator [Micromonospora chalcea]|nr:transcriptional regulator [Micromonospora chalcea]